MSLPAADAIQPEYTQPLITRDHPEYHTARSVWNGMIDRHPLLIAQPVDAAEVARAVRLAVESGLPLAVKGGGHGVAGKAVCDDGIVIDLCQMNAASVDPVARTATVQGGALLRTLDSAGQEHGLATTAGIFRHTGVVGLALGGGVGLLMRHYGMTCDNLLSAEVVTADGRILRASEEENPDLFWGLRGGGGNFGVVTEMVFRLYPLTQVVGGRMRFDAASVERLLPLYCEVMAEAPDDLQIYFGYGTDLERASASIVICYSGNEDIGEAVAERFRALDPFFDSVAPMPYLALQQTWDDSFPHGHHSYWKSSFLTAISEDALGAMWEAVQRSGFSNCSFDLEPMGGAVGRVDPTATPIFDRDAAGNLLITTGWTDPAESDARIAWIRETFAAGQPFCKAAGYANYMDRGDEHRTEAVYNGNFDRLRAVKRQYDPGNLFRPSANIVP